MRKITAVQLVNELSVFDKMAQVSAYSARFCLDDYLIEEVQEAIKTCNRMYPAYHFTHELVYGGFGHDLVVVDRKKKAAYDKLPKPYTYEDCFVALKEEFGRISSAWFDGLWNQRLTEEEYQEMLTFYRELQKRLEEKRLEKKSEG